MAEDKHSLSVTKEASLVSTNPSTVLPAELASRFALYPENRRRPVNKTLFKNEYFQLTYNIREQSMAVSSRGDIVYSAIPYDTARNYIQRAAIQYLLHPEAVHQYIESHKANLEKYLMLSIFQVTQKKVDRASAEVAQAYNEIFQQPLFTIQILGRLLQHDETGPLSANLAGKFLFSENRKTGISGYVAEYLQFIVQLTNALPLMTDGKHVQLMETTTQKVQMIEDNMYHRLTFESDIQPGLALLPQEVKRSIEQVLITTTQPVFAADKPLLRSEFGEELAEVRRNYVAHSVKPQELERYFENVHATENNHVINVVSDTHIIDGVFPFENNHFNILAGDISDSHVTNEEINGLYVIGNHELVDVLPDSRYKGGQEWDKWRPYLEKEWFNVLLRNPDDSWHRLPVGDHSYYEVVKVEVEKRFPKMKVLNNSSVIHNGIRFIGLTLPVAQVRRKKEQQAYILNTLKQLLAEDYETPTVIVSHAPLFNELSMLSPESRFYNEAYVCSEPGIEKLIACSNIIGVVHGHHRIPASSGRYKLVTFAGKELFVVCSIYSKMNTGFELMRLIDPSLLNK